MTKLIAASLIAITCAMSGYAHQAFTLVSSEAKTVKAADVAAMEKNQTKGKKEKTTLTFTEKEIRLVVLTGPEDDMLSYFIQGMRNPTLVVPAEAKLKLLFINVDSDMKHDIRFGHVVGEFVVAPEIKNSAGTKKLAAKADDGTLQAEEVVIATNDKGLYKYFCSVRGHAKGGMWGNIAVGVKPGAKVEPPKKTEHIHSADEDEDHDHHAKPAETKPDAKPTPTPTPHDHAGTEPGNKDEMPGMDHSGNAMKMPAVTNIGDPMERESSGTAWVPDSSPIYAKMKTTDGPGMWMFMGMGFLRYTNVGSNRDVSASGKGGRGRPDAPTMFMAMYSHPIGEKAQFGFRAMASLDPVIERGYGYPLLYQSGEQFRGGALHDRQHPHDLLSELAVTYSYKTGDKTSLFLYAGLPAEPAFGPPMYMHRTSGMNNPDAPIGHHWQDATHISYGVVTAGFSFGKAKIEASSFNGTEPNENRWNIDKPRLGSYTGRFSVNPTRNLSLQISHGYLKDPEPLEPAIRVLRKTSASAIYNKTFDNDRNWASTFVWGQNHANGARTNAFLLESNYDFYKHSVFGRFEHVQKSGHDLVLDHALEDEVFGVSALSLGYIHDIVQGEGIDVGLGGKATLNRNPAQLAPYYGGTTHGGWQLFLRFRPSKMGQ